MKGQLHKVVVGVSVLNAALLLISHQGLSEGWISRHDFSAEIQPNSLYILPPLPEIHFVDRWLIVGIVCGHE